MDNGVMRVRIVPTVSGKHAVQVVSKHHGVLTVHKHIGTFVNSLEKAKLFKLARIFIQEYTGQTSLLNMVDSLRPKDISITQSKPLFAYQLLSGIYNHLGLNRYTDPVIKDLVIARIYHPTSKRETRDVLFDLFDRQYSL